MSEFIMRIIQVINQYNFNLSSTAVLSGKMERLTITEKQIFTHLRSGMSIHYKFQRC